MTETLNNATGPAYTGPDWWKQFHHQTHSHYNPCKGG